MDKLVKNLADVVGPENVIFQPDELLVYECDGLPHHKYRPRAVVFPSSTAETSNVMRVLAREQVPFTPRGAGTGLSGGALALNQGVVVEMARMRRILKIDQANRLAVVQPGVVNAHVSRAVASLNLHYVPDPSSQPTCTIGGNIAESAGGIHCLKYGTTTDHVLGLKVVLAGGEIIDLGGGGAEQPGYDLTGLFIGSEGTFGIATEATLRLVPIPPSVRTLLAEFAEVNDASHAVSAIIAAGVMPAALEMMDREIIRAVEASVFAAGLSLDIGAALLIELDGLEAGIDDEAEQLKSICLSHGARSCRSAQDETERKKLWAARKGAFGAVGRISPDSMIQDAVVPRSRLPEVLGEAYRISAKYQLKLANVFHAGDGNLHPLICFDSRSADEVKRVKEAGRELMEVCVRAGGSITGEHGVGLDKRELLPLIFSEVDMDTMLRVRAAFDPSGLCNPGKIIPMLRGCGEGRAVGQSLTLANGNGSGGAVAEPAQVLAKEPVSAAAVHLDSAPSTHASQISSDRVETFTPESIEEVCEVMKLATGRGWAVIPAGAGDWSQRNKFDDRAQVVLSTRKLNRILEHEPADLIAVAEAGGAVSDLNHQLSRRGQWLPLDPPDDGSATIGGVVATGVGGPQEFGYGAPRRQVIGMKVVLADGQLIKAGGRVVKNVAGYDLCKLFTGSHGTLGVIVEVNFKLRPLPFETRTVIVSGTQTELLGTATSVITSRLFPTAVELVSPGLGREANLPGSPAHLLLMRFAGSPAGVQEQIKGVTRLTGALSDSTLTEVADDAAIWQTVASWPYKFADGLICRARVKPSDLPVFLNQIDEMRASESLDQSWHAGIGDGRVRLFDRSGATQGRDVKQAASNFNKLRSMARAAHGSLILESGPPEFLDQVDAWGDWGSPAALMRRIKQQLDPEDILSPGRFRGL